MDATKENKDDLQSHLRRQHKNIERYCLRLLLIDVRAVTNFDSLRTVDRVEFVIFKLASISRNLLEDD